MMDPDTAVEATPAIPSPLAADRDATRAKSFPPARSAASWTARCAGGSNTA